MFFQAIYIISSSAITFGSPDTDNKYPNVGAMVIAEDQDNAYVGCSGSLIHPQVFLTAGHCTYFMVDFFGIQVGNIKVSFDNTDATNPSTWKNVVAAYWHPNFSSKFNSNDSQDVGVLILEEPVVDIIPILLPSEKYLDNLKANGSLLKAYFARAGYGTRLEFPPPTILDVDNQRWFTEDNKYQGLTKRFIITSQNSAAGNAGTGYGDSGSPVMWKNSDGEMVAVAVTSIGDPKLVALDKPFRIDTYEALSFIYEKIHEVDPDFTLAPPSMNGKKSAITWGNVKSSF